MAILKRLLMVLVAVLLIAVPATLAQGAPGGGPGKPPDVGNGGGGHGGGGNGGGKANPGNKLGDLYADLAVVARDSRGLPITINYEIDGVTYTCIQPITFVEPADETHSFVAFDFTGTAYPYVSTPYRIPLAGDTMPQSELTAAAEADDETELAPCDVAPEGLLWVSEVDLGRLNLGRAPERVLAKQLGDVEAFLTSGTVGLDASGRFTKLPDEDSTVDSPLANLAAYQSILETSPANIGNVIVADLDMPLSDWALTAAQFAAAAPKDDFVITVDTVQYLNRILSVPTDTLRNTLTGANYIGADLEEFLDFAAVTFLDGEVPTTEYSRSAMFPGCVEWYPIGSNTLMNQPLATAALGGGELTGSGIDGYVKLAEDAHQVLVFLHALGDNVQRVDPITESGVCPPPATP